MPRPSNCCVRAATSSRATGYSPGRWNRLPRPATGRRRKRGRRQDGAAPAGRPRSAPLCSLASGRTGFRRPRMQQRLKLDSAFYELIDIISESLKFGGMGHHAAGVRGGGVLVGTWRTSGGNATPTALNTAPAHPGACTRSTKRFGPCSTVSSSTRSRSRTISPHSAVTPAAVSRSSSSLRSKRS